MFWGGQICNDEYPSKIPRLRFRLHYESVLWRTQLVYLNGNNAAQWEKSIKYASSYPMNWTVKNWFVQDFKGHGHDTDEGRDYDEDSVPFERLEKVYVPDEDSLEQRMNIFHGQLYSLYRDNRKFRLPLQLFFDKE